MPTIDSQSMNTIGWLVKERDILGLSAILSKLASETCPSIRKCALSTVLTPNVIKKAAKQHQRPVRQTKPKSMNHFKVKAICKPHFTVGPKVSAENTLPTTHGDTKLVMLCTYTSQKVDAALLFCTHLPRGRRPNPRASTCDINPGLINLGDS